MKTNAKKLTLEFLTVLSVIASWAFPAKACDPNFHLLLVSEWGAPVVNISIWDDNGNYVISGASLGVAEVVPYDLNVTPGVVYHFYGYDTGYGQDFYFDFTPIYQEGLLDVIGYPFIYYEWGGLIGPPTTYTISTSSSPSGSGTTSGGGTKNCDATVTVTATPAAGYVFVNWTEGGTEVSTTASYTFVVTGNRTLAANFAPTVSVSATLPDAWESTEDPGVFTITRSAGLATSLTVSFQISGTATRGIDYPEINPRITIPAGATSAKIFVWPFRDNMIESNETVALTLQSGIGYVVGNPSSATVTIHDDVGLLIDPKANGLSNYTGPESYYGGTVDLTPWVFTPGYEYVPINGIVYRPTAAGPKPLILFVHGCGGHFPPDGLGYLCAFLASHGIIAASMDFPDGAGGLYSGPEDGGILVLENVRHLLSNYEVDTNHIMLVGHSCGGEKVGFAVFWNTYSGSFPIPLDGSQGFGPYNFNFKGVVGLAPQDIDNPAGGPENLLILGGIADDTLLHQRLYNRWHTADPSNPAAEASGFKAFVQIYGANHSYFFSNADPDPSAGITLTEQMDATKVYVGAMARVVLLNQPEYLKFLQHYRFAASSLSSGVTNVFQFQSAHRLFIDDYEEDSNRRTISVSSLFPGTNAWSVASDSTDVVEEEHWDGNTYPSWIVPPAISHQVHFHWSNPSHYYQVSFVGANGLNSVGYTNLALRLGQSYENIVPAQYMRIVVQDKAGNSASYGVSLPPGTGEPIRTVRISLHGLATAGVDVTKIASITLTPEAAPLGSTSGTVYFDDIQLSD